MASTCLAVAAICSFFSAAQSYVLSTDCEPYREDIASAMSDVVSAAEVARSSLDPAFGARVTVADWFGLMNPVFHGIMDEEEGVWNESLIGQYSCVFSILCSVKCDFVLV